MLSFTHKEPNSQANLQELDFEPLLISNQPRARGPFPQTQQKKITKTFTNSRSKEKIKQSSRQSSQRQPFQSTGKMQERDGWVDRGKIQIFDRNLRKNALAEQQRRLRAEVKKEKTQAVRELTRNQKNIRGKTLQIEKDQQAEINQLKKMIEKERDEKNKNQQAYNQRMKDIERERNDLVKLERKIQQHGVKNQKEYRQELNVLHKNEYPTNDRGKCHQELRQANQPGPQYQFSQSEANAQRQALRQKQLDYLTNQREKCMQNQTTLSYNPTIVPLLSRASYKIISTHVSTLVELLVDDLMEEQVYMLEEIELQEKMKKEKEKENNMIQDYYDALGDFVDEAEEIEHKVGRYSTMKFQDLYFPKHYPKQQKRQYKTDFQQMCLIEGLDPDIVEQINNRRDRYVRFVGNFDEYKKTHLAMFEKVTEELIDEAILKMAHELDRGSNDFVDVMFRKEFQ